MKDIESIFLEILEEADLVLVGIGEEFQIKGNPEKEVVERIKQAYKKLEKLLDNKNYFIVSTCIDDYIYHTGLKSDKIVTPCGGYRNWQCPENCQGIILPIEDGKSDYFLMHGNRSQTKPPLCKQCKKQMVYNNINAVKYASEGYEKQWQIYTKWLQGTLNRKLCVLELGVGMQFPTVIRWPFEKIVYFNNKASFFRIHSKLFHLTEELKDKGYTVEENPVDFLLNRFV